MGSSKTLSDPPTSSCFPAALFGVQEREHGERSVVTTFDGASRIGKREASGEKCRDVSALAGPAKPPSARCHLEWASDRGDVDDESRRDSLRPPPAHTSAGAEFRVNLLLPLPDRFQAVCPAGKRLLARGGGWRRRRARARGVVAPRGLVLVRRRTCIRTIVRSRWPSVLRQGEARRRGVRCSPSSRRLVLLALWTTMMDRNTLELLLRSSTCTRKRRIRAPGVPAATDACLRFRQVSARPLNIADTRIAL